MDKEPRVSIIIANYNQAKYVEEAINSALNQTYKNIEIVVINDGSIDNSSEIIKSIADKHENIIFIDNNDNKGVVYTRNVAIDASSGKYILPLDADDTIEPTYVEKATDILDNNPNIGIVYCKAKMFGLQNKYWHLPEFNKDNILFSNCIFCTALFRKSDFLKAGKYKEYMKNGNEDWDLWLSFLELGLDVYRIDEILFNYRQVEDSRTHHCVKNINDVLVNLLTNHQNLYFSNQACLDRIFGNSLDFYKEKYKKYIKYKRIFSVLTPIVIIETIFIIVLLIILCI